MPQQATPRNASWWNHETGPAQLVQVAQVDTALRTPQRQHPAAGWRRKAPPVDFAHMDDGDVLLDCQRYMNCWFGVVKVRDPAQTRIVHVCTQLRGSARSALDDAWRDAQNLAPMFAQ